MAAPLEARTIKVWLNDVDFSFTYLYTMTRERFMLTARFADDWLPPSNRRGHRTGIAA